jgi:hypothetical protein
MNNLFTSGIYALGLSWVMFRCFNSCIGINLINFNDLSYYCTCFLSFTINGRFLEKPEFFFLLSFIEFYLCALILISAFRQETLIVFIAGKLFSPLFKVSTYCLKTLILFFSFRFFTAIFPIRIDQHFHTIPNRFRISCRLLSISSL